MTIYDIATAAGVSASTVSRVINHKSGIRKETREKIEKLIEEYNYSPNVAARGLVMQSSKMIGILLVDIRVVHHIDNAFAIEQELAKRGYCSIIMSTGADEANIGSCIRQLEQRRVEGIALIGSMFMAKSTYHTIKTSLPNIPVVIINGYIDLPNVTGIIADEESGVTDCVALLARKGRKNIVYVNDADSPANRNKRKGFLAGIRALGYPQNKIYEAATSYASGYEITKEILREDPSVDGIIYSVDLTATGGLRALLDSGRKVPEDISVIGVDNSIYAKISYPQLTSLDNNAESQSKLAVDLLIKALNDEPHERSVLLKTHIVERETT